MSTKVATGLSIKPGSYLLIDGVPCKCLSTDTSKPGKHGSTKVRIVAVGLFDDRKRELVMPAQDNLEVPLIEKRTAQVLNVNGNIANVMDDETFETFDLEIPEELKAEVAENSKVMFWVIMDKKVMKQMRGSE